MFQLGIKQEVYKSHKILRRYYLIFDGFETLVCTLSWMEVCTSNSRVFKVEVLIVVHHGL